MTPKLAQQHSRDGPRVCKLFWHFAHTTAAEQLQYQPIGIRIGIWQFAHIIYI
jgi:hypothetical protein